MLLGYAYVQKNNSSLVQYFRSFLAEFKITYEKN